METTLIHWGLIVVAVASVLHVFLPPYETFAQFPRFQKYYKAFVDTVGWIALNARGNMIKAYGVNKPPTTPTA